MGVRVDIGTVASQSNVAFAIMPTAFTYFLFREGSDYDKELGIGSLLEPTCMLLTSFHALGCHQ